MRDARAARTKAGLFGLAALRAVCGAALMAAAPVPSNVKPEHWTRQSASQLLGYVEKIGSHGLNPVDYDRDALLWAIEYGSAAQLDQQASESFALAARDLANGHIRPAERRRFSIVAPSLDPRETTALIDHALAANDIDSVLNALAPTDPQYAALRAALAKLPPGAVDQRRKIEASLERWRWLPRELGATHLLVNIPEYRVHLRQGGKEIATNRIIVGKPNKPTPQFAAKVAGVIVNPVWEVPQSIIAESVGKLIRTRPQAARALGYAWSSSGGALHVSQAPGPQNSLGQMKFDMPNGFTVYMHDTPNKNLFDKLHRTFSHGCIRTDKIFDLAAALLAPVGWTPAMIDSAVATRKTQRVALQQPVPVYVLYLTAYAEPDGTVRYYDDPYSLDGAVYESLHRG